MPVSKRFLFLSFKEKNDCTQNGVVFIYHEVFYTLGDDEFREYFSY